MSSSVAVDLAAVGHGPPLVAPAAPAAAPVAAAAAALVVAKVFDRLGRRRAGAAEEEAAADEAVVRDLREGDEAEAHAEPEESAGAGNVSSAAHLLGLAEPLRVGLLQGRIEIEKMR